LEIFQGKSTEINIRRKNEQISGMSKCGKKRPKDWHQEDKTKDERAQVVKKFA
jgi:hypothetical protein